MGHKDKTAGHKGWPMAHPYRGASPWATRPPKGAAGAPSTPATTTPGRTHTMPIIIGIDPSLTGTGIARVDTNDRLYIDLAISATTGKEAATLTEKRDRLALLVDDIDTHAMGIHSPDGKVADLVLIETPALSKANTGTSMLNGLFWMLVDRLHVHRIPVAPVGAGQLKKYATGKGNVSKGAVIDSCARRLPHAPTEGNDNLCDATWLAAMGADHLGAPLVELPKAHREALDKVAWPDAGPRNVPVPHVRPEGPAREGVRHAGYGDELLRERGA